MEKHSSTYWVKIYLSGPIDQYKQVCREFVIQGLCVTINETLFIYTGGEEYGVEIGLINYPRFPVSEENLLSTATLLADKLRNIGYQHSYLIMTPETTIWNSNREK